MTQSLYFAPFHVCNKNSNFDKSCDAQCIFVVVLTNHIVDLTILKIVSTTTYGCNTVMWTVLDPCTCISKSDSKLYTSFKYVKKYHKKYLNKLIYKAKQFILTKTISK